MNRCSRRDIIRDALFFAKRKQDLTAARRLAFIRCFEELQRCSVESALSAAAQVVRPLDAELKPDTYP
jgi:hypothetical protein